MINCLFCDGKVNKYSSHVHNTCINTNCKSWIFIVVNEIIILTSYNINDEWYLFSLPTTSEFDISVAKNSFPTGQVKGLFILDKIDKESVLNKLDYLKYLS